jgi:hypothetical protein
VYVIGVGGWLLIGGFYCFKLISKIVSRICVIAITDIIVISSSLEFGSFCFCSFVWSLMGECFQLGVWGIGEE